MQALLVANLTTQLNAAQRLSVNAANEQKLGRALQAAVDKKTSPILVDKKTSPILAQPLSPASQASLNLEGEGGSENSDDDSSHDNSGPDDHLTFEQKLQQRKAAEDEDGQEDEDRQISSILTGGDGSFRFNCEGKLRTDGFEVLEKKIDNNTGKIVDRSLVFEVPNYSANVVHTESKINLQQLFDQSRQKHRICAKVLSVVHGRMVHFQRTNGWHNFRKRMLTASDASACIDREGEEWYVEAHHPFKTRDQLIKEKKQKSKPVKSPSTLPMRHGIANEPIAIDMLVKEWGVPMLMWKRKGRVKAIDFGLIEHKEHTFIGGSPDGITADGDLVEIKCPFSLEKRKQMKAGVVPLHHQLQIQCLLEVTGLDRCLYAVFRPVDQENGLDSKMCVTVVPRRQGWFSRIILPEARALMAEVSVANNDDLQTNDVSRFTYYTDGTFEGPKDIKHYTFKLSADKVAADVKRSGLLDINSASP